jgi:hypothetical protein
MTVSIGEEKPIRKTKEKQARPIRKTIRQAILGWTMGWEAYWCWAVGSWIDGGSAGLLVGIGNERLD